MPLKIKQMSFEIQILVFKNFLLHNGGIMEELSFTFNLEVLNLTVIQQVIYDFRKNKLHIRIVVHMQISGRLSFSKPKFY